MGGWQGWLIHEDTFSRTGLDPFEDWLGTINVALLESACVVVLCSRGFCLNGS